MTARRSSAPKRATRPALVMMVVIVCACSHREDLPGAGDDRGRTVLYRDTWGVAHIYAPTVAAGLYAEGWAQAEDRPEQLLRNLMMATGEYESISGDQEVPMRGRTRGASDLDLRSRMWDHIGVARRSWGDLRPEVREQLAAYVDGINDYYAAHPADVPAWWKGRRVDPYMIVAFARFFAYTWSIDEAYADLRRGGIEPGEDVDSFGSNEFVVAVSRSAEGAPILAIDPHNPWDGPARVWELRIHAGALEGSGIALPGMPYIGNGHTRTLAWAMTTGGPDTADVYELTLDPENRHRYRYDGAWRDMTWRDLTESAGARWGEGDAEETPERAKRLWFSHHGPIVAWKGAKAYAAKIAYADVGTIHDALYELNLGAGGYQAAMRAMATLAVFPQNVMVADTAGHVYYQRTGRVPRRPDGYDWSRPVDGSTSATEWQGFHPASDHLQVLDPPQGFMQNCNVSPDSMMPGSPFRVELAVRPYLFGAGPSDELEGAINQRGARAVELLAADDAVSADDAMAYINDVAPFGASRWIEALVAADRALGSRYSTQAAYRLGIDALTRWDGRVSADSRGALVYESWREQLLTDLGEEKLRELSAGVDDLFAIVSAANPSPLRVSEAQQDALAGALARGMDRLLASPDGAEAVYGDRHRVGRGERSWPIDGGSGASALGMTTLRRIDFGPERGDGTRWGIRGQSATQVVILSDPPRSWNYVPWGQSDRPASPHYADQAEKLFSRRRFKPSWWLPEDLAGHIESRTVLDHAPAAPAN
jgi:acyl-homoserine lactone acylase PvdQ